MQLTKEFAATLNEDDRLAYTDVFGDYHESTLERSSISAALWSGFGQTVRSASGDFSSLVVKLHWVKRAKPKKTVVAPGDILDGIDATKIVPVGTIGHLGAPGSLLSIYVTYWNGEHWVIVAQDGEPTSWQLQHTVGEALEPASYFITITSVPEGK